MTARDDATAAQVAASTPGVSTWLSANAGSGKTRVLTERVARLLLEGTPPQNILCLTYTKAAAGEMQNRLFRTLGQWSMKSDAALSDALNAIGADVVFDLSRARTLFARAIETPGGLKIQTIHSFCAALLRQFPLEAGVSPQFTEIDDSGQKSLLAEIAERIAEEDPDGCFSAAAPYLSVDSVGGLLSEIYRSRDAFATKIDRPALQVKLGLSPDLSPDELVAKTHIEQSLIARVMSALKHSESTNDGKAFDKLAGMRERAAVFADLPILESVFLTGEGAKAPFSPKIGSFPTKAARQAMTSDDLDALNALMERVADARPKRLALEATTRTLALHGFARSILRAYTDEKVARGWLDFDDLIEKTSILLTDKATADWVLYRLDGAIDHILVDEAQDTSPGQWRIIESLTGEFGTGEGARDVDRTLFVVGDKKQSIYSFQGADLAAFETNRVKFGERLASAGGLAERELVYSFRSAPAVLQTVDAVFHGGLGGPVAHKAFFDHPGRVDLWPLVQAAEKPEDQPWYDPVDLPGEDSRSSRLATGIAQQIQRMIDDAASLIVQDGVRRRLHPGDFLILVATRQGQEEMFQTLIRACKESGLPVAGADKMKLESELAVRDLCALLAFLALPEDDLSLAAVLRSPLFGWSENDLYRLAAGRGDTYLWATLRACDEAPETRAILDDLRETADFLRPFELLERVLIRHNGRRKLLGRLGQEAEDGIDALLDLALNYERGQVPSLTGFLSWLDTEDTEVKRPLDKSGGAVRIMTVHGAKGLESPVVILPDTTREDQRVKDEILDVDGVAHWPPRSALRPSSQVSAAKAAKLQAAEERERLLYVAMTRAESWLIVCGINPGTGQGQHWHAKVSLGLDHLETRPLDTPFGEGVRFETGNWSVRDSSVQTEKAVSLPTRPDWATRAPPPAEADVCNLSPSDLGGAKALPGEGLVEEDALRFGRMMHRLLEYLPDYPKDQRKDVGAALLQHGEDIAIGSEAELLTNEAVALVEDPALSNVFADGTLAEVAFTAVLPEFDKPFAGIMDRLVPTEAGFLIVDFKTNRLVPRHEDDIPEGVLRQLGAYEAAAKQIFPERTIEVAVLWTHAAKLMPVTHEKVRSALIRAATS